MKSAAYGLRARLKLLRFGNVKPLLDLRWLLCGRFRAINKGQGRGEQQEWAGNECEEPNRIEKANTADS